MRPLLIGVLAALVMAAPWNQAVAADEPGTAARRENEVTLPSFPQDADLQDYYVSAVATNRYLIDAKSITVGDDGIVRYTLVVLTAGGATNVSYEGMRCRTGEVKLLATGHADRTWTLAHNPVWRMIENKPVNRHHAALARDYFCPLGNPIQSAEEGRAALRRGKHPDVS